MSSDRINEVDSVFKVSSRINSTWGGNLVDMYRAKRIFEIIEEENMVDNAAKMGEIFQKHLVDLQASKPDLLSSARGRGLFCAIDLPDPVVRDKVISVLAEDGLLALKCGQRTVRFRPPLNVSKEEIDRAAEIIGKALTKV